MKNDAASRARRTYAEVTDPKRKTMHVAALHSAHNEQKLQRCLDFIVNWGAPVIRVFRHRLGYWQAIEGSHRLGACRKLRIAPVIYDVSHHDGPQPTDVIGWNHVTMEKVKTQLLCWRWQSGPDYYFRRRRIVSESEWVAKVLNPMYDIGEPYEEDDEEDAA